MFSKRRFADLDKNLELWYEQLGASEKKLPMTTTPREITAIQQQIREEILPQIRKYESEYWELLAQESRCFEVTDIDAYNAIVEVVPEVELIANKMVSDYPEQLMQKLQEILDKLNEPGTPASAKAKFALNLVPGILSYEIEIDTENSLRRAFEPIKELFKKPVNEGK